MPKYTLKDFLNMWRGTVSRNDPEAIAQFRRMVSGARKKKAMDLNRTRESFGSGQSSLGVARDNTRVAPKVDTTDHVDYSRPSVDSSGNVHYGSSTWKEREAMRQSGYEKEAEENARMEYERMADVVNREIRSGMKDYNAGLFPGDAGVPSRFTKMSRFRNMLYAPTVGDAYRYTDDYRNRRSTLGAVWDEVLNPALNILVGEHPEIYEGTGVTRVGPDGRYYRYPSFGFSSEITRDPAGNPVYDGSGVLQVRHPFATRAANAVTNAAVWADLGLGAAGWLSRKVPALFGSSANAAGKEILPKVASEQSPNLKPVKVVDLDHMHRGPYGAWISETPGSKHLEDVLNYCIPESSVAAPARKSVADIYNSGWYRERLKKLGLSDKKADEAIQRQVNLLYDPDVG